MKRVLVIGDGCKDVFQYGICERISPEAPIPIFKPINNTFNGGMAVNVYNNLIALGVKCDIITDSGITKTRYVDKTSNQMLLRIDENDEVDQIEHDDLLTIDYDKYYAIVISDYDKGFLLKEDIHYISERHPLVFIDTKKEIGKWCLNIKYIKINFKEFNRNRKFLCEEYRGNLIVTKGNDGAILYPTAKYFPLEKEYEVRDLSGAGDTFLAGLVADYIKNNDICKAIEYANKCSSWVVTQKGVVVVNINNI